MIKNYDKEIDALKSDVKKLKESVNGTPSVDPNNTTGKPGDIRITEDSDGNIYLEGKTKNGWYSTVKGAVVPKEKTRTTLQASLESLPKIISGSLSQLSGLQLKFPFDYGKFTEPGLLIDLATIPKGYFKESVLIYIENDFNGGTIQLLEDNVVFMDEADSDCTKAFSYGGEMKLKLYRTDTTISAIFSGTPTRGNGVIYMKIFKG